jgi:hypothetical protein
MATVRQRRRNGGAREGSGAGDAALADLVGGMRGLGELTGNRALVSMLARTKRQPTEAVAGHGQEFDAQTQEEMLARLRLLLDAEVDLDADDPKKLLAALRRHVLLLVAVLHAALDQAVGYDGDLLDAFERLSQMEDEPGEHRAELMLELLHALQHDGEEVHSTLSDQLPRHGEQGEPPKVALALVARLRDRLRELREDVEADRPPQHDAHAEDGAGALLGGAPLLKKKRKLG